eukprot:14937373-Alexandrium_andersonii.AAC.1
MELGARPGWCVGYVAARVRVDSVRRAGRRAMERPKVSLSGCGFPRVAGGMNDCVLSFCAR